MATWVGDQFKTAIDAIATTLTSPWKEEMGDNTTSSFSQEDSDSASSLQEDDKDSFEEGEEDDRIIDFADMKAEASLVQLAQRAALLVDTMTLDTDKHAFGKDHPPFSFLPDPASPSDGVYHISDANGTAPFTT